VESKTSQIFNKNPSIPDKTEKPQISWKKVAVATLLSTRIADRHALARSCHYTRKVSRSVPASRAWRNAHLWEK